MEKQSGILKGTYSLGQMILYLIKLQGLWFLFTLRGGIIFGIFPATTAVFDALLYYFKEKAYPSKTYDFFKESYKKNFRIPNFLGYIQLVVMLILWLDLRVAGQLMKNRWVHFGLIILFTVALLIGLYLFPAYLRYEMKPIYYFKQSVLLLISNIVETLAILLGMFVALAIATFFPILLLIASVPMLIFPVCWFSYQAMLKIEKNNGIEQS